jgi:ParB-like chromosome segregation protein Spo0J
VTAMKKNNKAKSKLPVHAVCSLLPKPTDAQLEILTDSIKNLGVTEPVTTWRDPKGKLWIIDGRTRATIAESLGISYPTKEFKGTVRQVVEFARDTNLARREITITQKCAVLVDAERWMAYGINMKRGSKEQADVAIARERMRVQFGIGKDLMKLTVRCAARNRLDLIESMKAGTMSGRQAKDAISKCKRPRAKPKASQQKQAERLPVVSADDQNETDILVSWIVFPSADDADRQVSFRPTSDWNDAIRAANAVLVDGDLCCEFDNKLKLWSVSVGGRVLSKDCIGQRAICSAILAHVENISKPVEAEIECDAVPVAEVDDRKDFMVIPAVESKPRFFGRLRSITKRLFQTASAQ